MDNETRRMLDSVAESDCRIADFLSAAAVAIEDAWLTASFSNLPEIAERLRAVASDCRDSAATTREWTA